MLQNIIITPQLKQDLKKEIDGYMSNKKPEALTWSTIRQPKIKTGLPISWRNIYIIYNEAPENIKLRTNTVLSLLEFFGYKITFTFTKQQQNNEQSQQDIQQEFYKNLRGSKNSRKNKK